MIAAHAYGADGVSEVKPADISESVADPQRLLWVHSTDPTEDDLGCLSEEFGLHPLAIEDIRERHQRPKLEHYPSHSFLVAYSAALAEVELCVGPNWVISLSDESWTPESAAVRFERIRPEHATSGFLVYVLLDDLVDGYFTTNDSIEDDIETLEDRIFSERPSDERTVQQDLLAARRRLVVYRRAVAPLRDVVAALLRQETSWVDDATAAHLQDVYDHVLRVVDQLDSQRELMGNAVEAHLAIISNQMNQAMKTMTSWGAILLGSTLVAAIYGMNFTHMPELNWRLGYPFALGIMALITVAGYRGFKKRNWL